MNQSGNFADKWSAMFGQQHDEVLEEDSVFSEGESASAASGKPGFRVIFRRICKVCYHLRKLLMAAPVVYYALRLAAYNMKNLPEQVGINLLSNGEFAEMISRESAVMGPLVVTGACLALMFVSRKSVYPWLISIFTLVLPLLLLLTNNYPA